MELPTQITVKADAACIVDGVVSVRVAAELPTLHQMQTAYIEAVLKRSNGNKTEAAKVLGINRRTLYRRRKGNT